ncbi:hypothetical protein NBRC116592_25420 [Colwellia sp. KU-HH00111]|uniref:DUF3592 domain-containing protein n=1 Tax=Colwellia sp. KU-HH00111 TaxID=3127652 RepID=UPI00310B4C32
MNMLFWVVSIVLTLGVVAYGLHKFKGSDNWDNVSGYIVESNIETLYNGPLQQETGSVSTIEYKVHVKYNYIVNEVEFSGHRIMAGLPEMVVNKAEADELMTKYLKGNKVNVYYNPTNHAEAALITAKGVPLLAYFMVIMFVVSIIGAIIFVLKSNILSD